MKLISWNVNGIRAIAKKGFHGFLKEVKPDILCLQEIKISHVAKDEAKFDFVGYQEFWNPAERPGYSGTATLVKNSLKVINSINGLGKDEFDREGRVQTLEFEKFFLVNAYFPNSNHELSRLGYKQDFNSAYLKYVKKLEKKKSVILCGDFNVAHKEIDLKNPRANEGSAGFTSEERADMDKFVKNGLVDTFRHFYPKKIQYSWWSYRFHARAKNIGWRIDYFLVSRKIIKSVKNAFILDKITGSDHAPVGITLEL